VTQLSSDVGRNAPGHKIECEGQVFEFRHFGLPELAEFERERYRAERDKLRDLRDDYPTEVYVERLDRLRERYERKEFAFENDAKFRESPEGILLVLRLMTGRDGRDVLRLFCTHTEEVVHLVSLVIGESFPKARAGTNGRAVPATS
jgi:hypothetical protein